MKFFEKIKSYFGSMTQSLEQLAPESQIIPVGNPAHTRLKMKYKEILIVDDIPRHAEASLQAIQEFYTSGILTVFIAYSYSTALSIFKENDIKLVVIDADLADDHGDGVMLLREFMALKPDLTVLANSSESRYNERLMATGAKAVLSKDKGKFKKWLFEHGK